MNADDYIARQAAAARALVAAALDLPTSDHILVGHRRPAQWIRTRVVRDLHQTRSIDWVRKRLNEMHDRGETTRIDGPGRGHTWYWQLSATGRTRLPAYLDLLDTDTGVAYHVARVAIGDRLARHANRP